MEEFVINDKNTQKTSKFYFVDIRSMQQYNNDFLAHKVELNNLVPSFSYKAVPTWPVECVFHLRNSMK